MNIKFYRALVIVMLFFILCASVGNVMLGFLLLLIAMLFALVFA